ncbi:PHD finger protein ALFIN-LIKE 8-like isoform X2 [Asparagus officinalis]|uniref:PHD finger protein ALFIN-LIKE 8-like isoform X2 n=1 Tax=Asparagus officinalis TaxID=4686 RepID=UPI00098E428F|nr:PHD finger protein ALFIN-LIKE 8-like isoform X2 [Asparagus officinalis]
MEGGAGAYNPRTAEEVFRDFRGRRAGMIKALTTDVEKFYQLCDPDKENLCLYGLPNETWEVNLPAEEVPPELPEPALGINFARDGMDEKDWLSLVAVHSDAWLLAVAFYFGARFGFDKDARTLGDHCWSGFYWLLASRYCLYVNTQQKRRLFQMINGLPTIFEVVTGTAKKQTKERTPNSSKSNKSNSKPSRQSEIKTSKMAPPKEDDDSEAGGEEEEEDEDEHGNTLCGACGENYANDEFWICCDICERWFHGKCVRITPARAEHIKQYKCPACSNKRARA